MTAFGLLVALISIAAGIAEWFNHPETSRMADARGVALTSEQVSLGEHPCHYPFPIHHLALHFIAGPVHVMPGTARRSPSCGLI